MKMELTQMSKNNKISSNEINMLTNIKHTEVSDFTKEKLITFSDWAKKNLTNEKIEMEYFRNDEHGNPEDFIDKENCGTTGCLLGWFPFAIEPSKNHFNDIGQLCFFQYCEFDIGISSNDSLWDWLFDSSWNQLDIVRQFGLDTGLMRIDYCIKYGCPDYRETTQDIDEGDEDYDDYRDEVEFYFYIMEKLWRDNNATHTLN